MLKLYKYISLGDEQPASLNVHQEYRVWTKYGGSLWDLLELALTEKKFYCRTMLKKVSMAAMVHDAMERTWNSPGIRRMVPGRLIPGKMVKIKWFHHVSPP